MRELTVHVEIPSVFKEDIHVSIDGNLVSLREEIRQQDQQSKNQRSLHLGNYDEIATILELTQTISLLQQCSLRFLRYN